MYSQMFLELKPLFVSMATLIRKKLNVLVPICRKNFLLKLSSKLLGKLGKTKQSTDLSNAAAEACKTKKSSESTVPGAIKTPEPEPEPKSTIQPKKQRKQ
jgi:hypothetical protein